MNLFPFGEDKCPYISMHMTTNSKHLCDRLTFGRRMTGAYEVQQYDAPRFRAGPVLVCDSAYMVVEWVGLSYCQLASRCASTPHTWVHK
jgi:hypothetical protein